MIRAYQVKVNGKPGPWLAGMTLDPEEVSESWCHQRGYVCFIEELHRRPVKAGETFGAAYAVGWFDDVKEMERVYDGLKGKLAFNKFCRWEGTYFHFAPGITPSKPGPPTSLMRLLLEACDVQTGTIVRGPLQDEGECADGDQGAPGKRVVAGQRESEATKPGAGERAELVAEEGNAVQRIEMTEAEDAADDAGNERCHAEPEKAHGGRKGERAGRRDRQRQEHADQHGARAVDKGEQSLVAIARAELLSNLCDETERLDRPAVMGGERLAERRQHHRAERPGGGHRADTLAALLRRAGARHDANQHAEARAGDAQADQ